MKPHPQRPDPMRSLRSHFMTTALGLALCSISVAAQELRQLSEDFTGDPRWEGFRNRLLPTPLPVTRQEFGWRRGGRGHEIGGWIQRSLTPAWFAKVIPQQTLNDRLSASGKFAVTRDEGGSGVLFGWFNESSRGCAAPHGPFGDALSAEAKSRGFDDSSSPLHPYLRLPHPAGFFGSSSPALRASPITPSTAAAT